MQITMRDVAREANVSIKTVSRVVNEQGEISEETRERVLEAIDKLGYRPSKVARALVTRRTDTIGLVFGDISNPYHSEVARGVLDVAQEHEYDVFVCNTNGVPATEKRALLSLIDHNIDGTIIFSTWENKEWLQKLARPTRLLVVINKDVESRPGLSVIRTEIRQGAKLAVEYLVKRGHRAIGMIAGNDGELAAMQRALGYRDALEAHGIPYCEGVVVAGPPLMEHGIEATRQLLTEHPEVTAIFCYNDLIAIGALQTCKALSLDVPEACAIVGFDNIRMSALVCPSLTTVHVDKYGIGKQAAERLFAMLEQPERQFPPITVDVKLVRRESA